MMVGLNDLSVRKDTESRWTPCQETRNASIGFEEPAKLRCWVVDRTGSPASMRLAS